MKPLKSIYQPKEIQKAIQAVQEELKKYSTNNVDLELVEIIALERENENIEKQLEATLANWTHQIHLTFERKLFSLSQAGIARLDKIMQKK